MLTFFNSSRVLSKCLPKCSPSNTFPCKKTITIQIEIHAENKNNNKYFLRYLLRESILLSLSTFSLAIFK